MASDIFVTATDTDAGKSWITAAAVRALLAQGVDAAALKPVACGFDCKGRNGDIDALLTAQGVRDADCINRHRFALPAAPSQAAAAERQMIDPDGLLQWCRQQCARYDCTLIEGVGGLMTPITERWLVADWIAAMPDCELWLVIGCRLGAINQALLTLSKLKQMERAPARIFFNAATADDDRWIDPVRQAVEPFLSAGCRVTSLQYGMEPAID